MKFKRILSYFMWIPFAVAIGAFALYFKYLFDVKVIASVAVTGAINAVMNRYLRIGLFSLFVGLALLFVSKISKLIFNEDKYYNETYPWTNINNIKTTNVVEEKIEKEETFDDVSETIKEDNDDYIINMNSNISNKLVDDIKSDKILKARFIDKNDEKMIEILTDEEEELEVLSLDNVVLMPEIKKETIIKVDSSKVTVEGYNHCPKCKNLVDKDAVICVHCGILLNDNFKQSIQKKRIFNPISFAINAIIIIIGIIGIILMCNKIQDYKTVNESKVNSKTTINDILK